MSADVRADGRISAQAAEEWPALLHVITGMERGGAEKVAVQLIRASDSSTLAYLTGANSWHAELCGSSVNEHALNVRSLLDLPGAVRRLVDLLQRVRPQVLHSHLSHANIAARWAARRAGFRGGLISTEHNLGFYGRSGRLLLRLDARTSRDCHAVVAISRAVKEHRARSGWNLERIRVIYNGVDILVEAAPPSLHAPLRLGMVGRLHPEKGPDVFLRIVERIPDCEGRIVTRGEDHAGLAAAVRNSPAGNRFQVDRDAAPQDLFRGSDIVLVPSRLEGLGLVALEAMAHRRPVIASNTGGLPEVIVHGETGLLAEPADAGSFVNCIKAIADSPESARAMGDAGRLRVAARFSLPVMLEQYRNLYQEVAR